MTMESVLSIAFEYIKEALSMLEKVKDKKQKKEREDLIAKLRVFMKQNDDLINQVTENDFEDYTDVSVDESQPPGKEYADVEVAKPADEYTDVRVEESQGIYDQTSDNPNDIDGEQIYEDSNIDEINPTPTKSGSTITPVACEDLTSATLADFLELKREKSLMRGTWQKRWCVIEGNVFYMFDSSSDKKQKDALELKGCSVVVRDGLTKEAKRKERCFEVKTQQESKTYEFCASDKESVPKWKRAIEVASTANPVTKRTASISENPSSATNKSKNLLDFKISTKHKNTKKTVKTKLKSQVPDNINEDDDNVYTDTQDPFIPDDIYTDTAEQTYDDVSAPKDAHGKKPFLPAPHGSILNKKLPPTPGVEPSLPQLPAVPQLPPHPNGNLRNQAIGNEKVRSFINSTVPRTPPLKNVDHNSGSGEILPPPPPTVFDPAPLPPPPVEIDVSAENEDEEYKDIDSSDLFQGMWDCNADETNEMSFKRGQIVHIISKEYDKYGWWIAKRRGEVGFVPRDYLMEAYTM